MQPDIRVAEGSLTEGDELVLVNASNTQLQLGSGVSGAIRRACGKGFQARLSEVLEKHGGSLEPGAVVVTDAGEHPRARYIAHVAIMDYREGFTGASYPSLERVREGCQRLWLALEAAAEVVCHFPSAEQGLSPEVRAHLRHLEDLS